MRKPAPQHQGAKTSKLTPEQWQQVIKERVEEKISPDLVISPDLARKWNCGSDTIRSKVRKADLTLPKQYKKSPNLDPGGSRGLLNRFLKIFYKPRYLGFEVLISTRHVVFIKRL